MKVKPETIRHYQSRIVVYAQRFDPNYKPVVPPLARRLARLRAW